MQSADLEIDRLRGWNRHWDRTHLGRRLVSRLTGQARFRSILFLEMFFEVSRLVKVRLKVEVVLGEDVRVLPQDVIPQPVASGEVRSAHLAFVWPVTLKKQDVR